MQFVAHILLPTIMLNYARAVWLAMKCDKESAKLHVKYCELLSMEDHILETKVVSIWKLLWIHLKQMWALVSFCQFETRRRRVIVWFDAVNDSFWQTFKWVLHCYAVLVFYLFFSYNVWDKYCNPELLYFFFRLLISLHFTPGIYNSP